MEVDGVDAWAHAQMIACVDPPGVSGTAVDLGLIFAEQLLKITCVVTIPGITTLEVMTYGII